MSDVPQRFKDSWKEVLVEFNKQRHYMQLASMPSFKELKVECKEEDFQPCSSLTCPFMVLPLSGLYNKGDGKQSRCTHCHNGVGLKAVVEASKQAVAEAGPRFSNSETENEAREWLTSMLKALPDEAKRLLLTATPEFRTADAGARELGSEADAWWPILLRRRGLRARDHRGARDARLRGARCKARPRGHARRLAKQCRGEKAAAARRTI